MTESEKKTPYDGTVINRFGSGAGAGSGNNGGSTAGNEGTPGTKAGPDDGTVFNAYAGPKTEPGTLFLKAGDLIPGGFEIVSGLNQGQIGAEADLYLVNNTNPSIGDVKKRYVAKVFKRDMAEKTLLFERLRKVDSSHVAKIYYSGEIFDKYFEIYEYYERGSLADSIRERRFSEDELKRFIIPNLNEALHDLHEGGILHRDIKPSNIMWSNDDENTLVLIDFGLSSAYRESKSIVVSQIGFTASYAAPEVLRNVYFDESDYYSLGIILYEMFTGKTPFGDDNSYTSVITKPGNMPVSLYNLILGLTYQDLSYRHDPSNPNHRWTYEDVNRWLSGEEMIVPGFGEKGENEDNSSRIPPLHFCGEEYTDLNELCLAVGYHWEEGRNLLLSGRLSAHLRGGYATARQHYFASVIEDGMNEKADSDVKICKILYALSPGLDCILCPMGVYGNVKEWGEALMEALNSFARQIVYGGIESAEMLFKSGVLSDFCIRYQEPEEIQSLIKEFENRSLSREWFSQRERNTYEFAYRLTGNEVLNPGLPDGKTFTSVEEVKEYLMTKKGENYTDLYRTVTYFIDGEHKCKPAFYGWLKGRGYSLADFE